MTLALEFWTRPFRFLINAPANFAVFAYKLLLGGLIAGSLVPGPWYYVLGFKSIVLS